jgi:hypothetical protein
MRPLVVIAALVLGLTAHAQQDANTEPADPATKARVRVEGAAGGTGARPSGSGANTSVEGGASLGATGVNAPAPRTAGMPPRPGDDMPPRPGDYARPDTRDTQPGQDDKAEENPAQEKRSAEAKEDREASTGATSPRY